MEYKKIIEHNEKTLLACMKEREFNGKRLESEEEIVYTLSCELEIEKNIFTNPYAFFIINKNSGQVSISLSVLENYENGSFSQLLIGVNQINNFIPDKLTLDLFNRNCYLTTIMADDKEYLNKKKFESSFDKILAEYADIKLLLESIAAGEVDPLAVNKYFSFF